MFFVEVVFETGGTVRMVFASKRRADNARKKIAAGMAKGKFRNSDDAVTVKSDASTYDIRTSNVQSVSVNDRLAWADHQKAEQDALLERGLIEKRTPPTEAVNDRQS